MGSQASRYRELDLDREKGCIRDVAHAYYADGGLAVLYGNLAERGSHREDRRRRPLDLQVPRAPRGCSTPRRAPATGSWAAR